MRRGCLIASGVTTALLIGTSLYGAYRLIAMYWDFPSAAGELPKALAEYQAHGLPFEAKEVAPQHLPLSQDAAPTIRAAIEKLPPKAAGDALAAAVKKGDPVPASLVAPFESSLALVEAAVGRDSVDFCRDWDLGPHVLFPEYAGMKAMAKAAVSRAVLAAARGDDPAALKDLTLARKLALWADQEPSLISMLVRIANETITLGGVERCLVAVAHDPKRIARYERWLAEEPPLPEYGHALRGEAFMGVTTFRNLDLFGGIEGMSQWEEGSAPRIDPARLRRSGLPTDHKTRAFLTRHLQIWNEAYQTTDGFREPAEKIGRRLDAIGARLEKEKGLSYVLERILLPVFGQAGEAVVSLQARRAVQKGFAEALRYRAESGRWPEAVSPIDPFTGKPLKVKVKGFQFRVYSVGKDRKDDGGLHRREKAAKGKIVDEVAVYPPIKP